MDQRNVAGNSSRITEGPDFGGMQVIGSGVDVLTREIASGAPFYNLISPEPSGAVMSRIALLTILIKSKIECATGSVR